MSSSSCSAARDPACAPRAERMQRSQGEVRVGVRGRALHTLFQSGCLRACFPRPHGGPVEVVIVNTAGGIADGDDLLVHAVAERGAELVVTTPSAERIYRARSAAAPARVRASLQVGPGAQIAYLPQETILFEGCALDRTLDVELDAQGSYLGVEALVFGRQESGETIGRIRLRDTCRLRRNGRLVLQDGVRLQGQVAALLGSRAGAGGRTAIATIVYAAPNAEAKLSSLRQILNGAGAASAWDGIVVARFRIEAERLRAAIVAALLVLHGRELPRVWS